MSKQIHAIFDGTDMAEFARMRLKREGIDVESFNVKPIAKKGGGDETDVILSPHTQNGYAAESFWMDSSRVQPYGGVLFGTNTDTFENRTRNDDIYSSEVSLVVTVPDGQASDAEAILRSCHGYSIKIK
ncbi:MAG: hypothetical protein ACOX1Q_05800 [Eubacteriales bacterium]|jgi:hypothetical protein